MDAEINHTHTHSFVEVINWVVITVNGRVDAIL